MKPRKLHATSVVIPLAYAIAGLMASSVIGVQAADQFFDGSTTNALTTAKWAATNAGPFTSAFTAGSTAVFATVSGTGTGAGGITVGGIRAEENFTLSSPSGTLATGGTVATVDVFLGKTLDLGTLAFSTAAGTGFIKSGSGVWATAGGAYAGGFTLTGGTVILRGANAMGAGGALTINGGTIAAIATQNLTGKYTGGITVGGNFTLGATTGLALSAANLTFTNNMDLGAATRTITLGGTGVYTFGGIVSGASGTGLVVDATAAGRLTLTTAATYNGGTTIKGGILADGVSAAGHTDTFGSGSITLGDSSGSKDAALYGFVASSAANVFTGALTVANGSSGTLAIVGNNTTMTFSNTVALNNNLTLGNANTGKIITLSGPITQISNGTGYTITNGATIAGTNATAALTGQALLSGGVEIGIGGLTLTNNATQLFTVGTGNITSTSTGNLTLNANSTGAFTVSAANTNHTGSITNSGTGSGATTISGIIGSNVTGLTQNSGNSKLILTGANSGFIGNTVITSGTLQLQNTNSLQNSVVNMNGGSVSFGTSTTVGLTSVALGGLEGSGNINLNNFLAVPTVVNLTIGNSNGQNATYSGALSNTNGNASLTKVGNNTQTLSGANSYGGATSVSSGALTITFTGNINSSSAVTVAAGAKLIYNSSTALTVGTTLNGSGTSNRAILGGTGTINTILILDNVGDTLSPGNSPGIQTFTPAQTWNSFSYDWEVNDFSNVTGLTVGSDFDRIALSNTLGLTGGSGSYTLNVLSLSAGNVSGDVPNFSEIDRSWTILTTTSGITGFNAANWTINTAGFTNGDNGTWALGQVGNDLLLSYTVVPEPPAALLGGLGLFVLLRRRRA